MHKESYCLFTPAIIGVLRHFHPEIYSREDQKIIYHVGSLTLSQGAFTSLIVAVSITFVLVYGYESRYVHKDDVFY